MRPFRHFLHFLFFSFALSTACGVVYGQQQQDPFAEGVRPTDPLTPEQQLKTFHVPEGFEVQLVAAEPDIAKPMNLQFDAKGRLWVTSSLEYPFAAPKDKEPRDSLRILDEIDANGRAKKVTIFADKLNIPIGHYPTYDGGAIVYGIPNIWKMNDSNGDGVADSREVLYGPMGWERDTHGMNNAFRRAYDGWIYACHGYNNNTRVQGKDGHVVEMNSGNTYRFRLDGSRIEQFTWGQVNPFGLALDPLFNWFTADCHSKPVYQLLRGGYYPSFGKPHDGLGYVPPVMDHDHGSTAICGIVCYTASHFPPQYANHFFSGNVMTSRINHNSLIVAGSTYRLKEEPDFVKCDDPWFRPVDIQIGPDGAMYIADFYNKIIGHYEVPLMHPGRDRHRGRIWRIVYKGREASKRLDLTTADTDVLVAALSHDVIDVRLRASEQLVDRVGKSAIPSLKKALTAESSDARVHAMWTLQRLQGLTVEEHLAALADKAPIVRTHACKAVVEIAEPDSQIRKKVIESLDDSDPFVQRAAAESLSVHPQYEHVRPLLICLKSIPLEDNHLRHMVRIALRNQVAIPEILAKVSGDKLDQADDLVLAEICIAVKSEAAGALAAKYAASGKTPLALSRDLIAHAARYAPRQSIGELIAAGKSVFADDPAAQLQVAFEISQALSQRGSSPPAALKDWAAELVNDRFQKRGEDASAWAFHSLPRSRGNQWGVLARPSADGDSNSPFLDSHVAAEDAIGELRSAPFKAPKTLSFFLAGHRGFPNLPAHEKNFVRLVDAQSGEKLFEAFPPRNDVAAKVEWDLSAIEGKHVYLSLVDGDDEDAYAWIAAGRFLPAVARIPTESPKVIAERQLMALQLASNLELVDSLKSILGMLDDRALEGDVAIAAGHAAARLGKIPAPALATLLDISVSTSDLKARVANRLSGKSKEEASAIFLESMKTLPRRAQDKLAAELASSKAGAELLISLIESGKTTAELLRPAVIQQQLKASLGRDGASKLSAILATLPPRADTLNALVEERRKHFAAGGGDHEKGVTIFKKVCANCHQVGGQGAIVGPQLDGIGNRGAERILEDTLDPNRNVDVQFRRTTLILDDGRIVSGLIRREEGETVVVADEQGKEQSIAKSTIEEKNPSPLSLMPEKVAADLTAEEFRDLMTYLSSLKAMPEPGK
jgi:putative heme-binding domain-containing protein